MKKLVLLGRTSSLSGSSISPIASNIQTSYENMDNRNKEFTNAYNHLDYWSNDFKDLAPANILVEVVQVMYNQLVYGAYNIDWAKQKLAQAFKENFLDDYESENDRGFRYLHFMTFSLLDKYFKELNDNWVTKSINFNRKDSYTNMNKFMLQSAVICSLYRGVPTVLTLGANNAYENIEYFVVTGVNVNEKDINKSIFRVHRILTNQTCYWLINDLYNEITTANCASITGFVGPFEFDQDNENYGLTMINVVDSTKQIKEIKIQRKWEYIIKGNQVGYIKANYGFDLLSELGILYFNHFKKHYNKVVLNNDFKISFRRQFDRGFGEVDHWLDETYNNNVFDVKNIINGDKSWKAQLEPTLKWYNWFKVSYAYYSATNSVEDGINMYLILQYYLFGKNSKQGVDQEFHMNLDFGSKIAFSFKHN